MLFSIATVVTSLEIDEDDGVWTDSFENNNNVILDHCEVVNGCISLVNETTDRIYDYSDSTDNDAYRH